MKKKRAITKNANYGTNVRLRLEEAAEAFQLALEVNTESELSRTQLEGLKQVEIARKMIAEVPLP